MSRHPKADMYMADRNNGMTLREIAEKHDVSFQTVACTIARVDPTYHKIITDRGCIYPNLRRWLNESKMNQQKLFSALRGKSVREFLKGERLPKKDAIDIMLQVTGMTYEEMFAEEEDHG